LTTPAMWQSAYGGCSAGRQRSESPRTRSAKRGRGLSIRPDQPDHAIFRHQTQMRRALLPEVFTKDDGTNFRDFATLIYLVFGIVGLANSWPR
jgi:hypothetical protein